MQAQKILLVDDEAGLRMTLAANLELEGFQVTEAESGERALALARERPFDVVLTDIRMPGMNGVELFKRLRQHDVGVPVVLMTAFALEGTVQEALEEGAFALLPKPFEVEKAIDVVGRAARLPAVVIVDDAERVAVSTAEALAACGLRAKAVTNAADALASVRGGNVDLCVVDMVMPDQSGPEVIEAIRRVDPAILVIAVSGHDVPQMIRRVAELGMHTFLKKPFRVQELLRAIASARSPGGRS